MSTTRASWRVPRAVVAGDGVRTYIAFTLFGLSNVILPFIVLSSAYLIVPYPRGVVILLEYLPAVAAKFLFPTLLFYVPYWARPLFAFVFWVLCGLVTLATPPNVPPLPRVLIVWLASATAAVTDVWLLGLLRYYRRPGLAGWGLGTGFGAVACAVIPYSLTVTQGRFLRNSTDYMYWLLPSTLLAYYVILPRGLMSKRGDLNVANKQDGESDEEDGSLLIQEPPSMPLTLCERMRTNLALATTLVRPYMLPLAVAIGAKFIMYPGITRTLAVAPAFGTFNSFSAAYGASFQAGNTVARSVFAFSHARKTRLFFTALGVATTVTCLNAAFLFIFIPIGVLFVACVSGFSCGAIYITVFSMALEDRNIQSPVDREVALGAIGAGESFGALLGGLIGALMETLLCRTTLNHGQRWCHRTR